MSEIILDFFFNCKYFEVLNYRLPPNLLINFFKVILSDK